MEMAHRLEAGRTSELRLLKTHDAFLRHPPAILSEFTTVVGGLVVGIVTHRKQVSHARFRRQAAP
jgi:hypothetical protein